MRRRMLRGVTSTISSLLMNSMARSRVNGITGVSWMLSSLLEARMLVNFFILQGLTLMSFSRLCSPMIIPS